jgi:DNA-binding NarL/FixJ family response regulator
MSTSYRFLLVSDSPEDYGLQVLREALIALGSLEVVAESKLDLPPRVQVYDVVIVDAGAVTSAATVVSRVRALDPDSKVVVVTASPHWKIARAVFRAGAAEYLHKSLDEAEILASFRTILEREPAVGVIDSKWREWDSEGNDSVR